ncbi:methyltransferase [Chryseobacterium joostei]|uniref:methyltransferase n=1 Tax=Chryseobacterium joostei TaxID=112234 RepID=UPI003D1342D6
MKKQEIKPESTFKMFEFLGGLWLNGCIKTAAELNIADLLTDGPKTTSFLAGQTQSHEKQLYRVMRALSSAGIFEESENRTFALNDLGAALQTDVPGTAKNFIITIMSEHLPAYGDLTYAVQTGKIPFDHIYGKDLWKFYKENPKMGENFGKGMTGMSGMELRGIIENYDFIPYKKIVDIGGGNGVMIHTILDNAPNSYGIIFDEANVIEKTIQMIPEHLKERCSVAIGSFFDKIPEGADLYTMKWIIHDWSDEECIQILKNCYNAMPKGAKLLIIDAVIPDDSYNQHHMAKLLDIVMMACLTGRERTLSEFKMLIEKVGLKFNRLIHIGTEAKSIIECEKE